MLAKQRSSDCGHSDGYLYWQVRRYQIVKDFTRVREWRSHLSPCKRQILQQLLKIRPIVDKLDYLCFHEQLDFENQCFRDGMPNKADYPGIIDGLELGNFGKDLASHCFEQIANFIGHINDLWECIIGRNKSLHPFVDPETVKCLQLLAPSASMVDRQYIVDMMEKGCILHQVSDPETRDSLKRNILSLNMVIPSLTTFHRNIRYFSIGAKILRQHIAVEMKVEDEDAPSLYQNLSRVWCPRESSIVEISEDYFQQIPEPPSSNFAFENLLLSSLRAFANLYYTRPLLDRKTDKPVGARIDDSFVSHLCRKAKFLGYSNSKIEKGFEKMALQPGWESALLGHGSQRKWALSDDAAISEWRCGKPSEQIYLYFQRNAYIPRMIQPRPIEALPCPLFVLNDLLGAFFGHKPYTHLVSDTVGGPTNVVPILPAAFSVLPRNAEFTFLMRHKPRFQKYESVLGKRKGHDEPEGDSTKRIRVGPALHDQESEVRTGQTVDLEAAETIPKTPIRAPSSEPDIPIRPESPPRSPLLSILGKRKAHDEPEGHSTKWIKVGLAPHDQTGQASTRNVANPEALGTSPVPSGKLGILVTLVEKLPDSRRWARSFTTPPSEYGPVELGKRKRSDATSRKPKRLRAKEPQSISKERMKVKEATPILKKKRKADSELERDPWLDVRKRNALQKRTIGGELTQPEEASTKRGHNIDDASGSQATKETENEDDRHTNDAQASREPSSPTKGNMQPSLEQTMGHGTPMHRDGRSALGDTSQTIIGQPTNIARLRPAHVRPNRPEDNPSRPEGSFSPLAQSKPPFSDDSSEQALSTPPRSPLLSPNDNIHQS